MKAKINFLREIILFNPQREWTVTELAKTVNVSPKHLQKLFKDEMRMSPIQFIKHLRLEKAREILENGFLNVKQISYEVGITDQSYFNREFKKKYGLAPNQYREQYHKNLKAEKDKSQ